jgi:hypothetical protein
MHLLSAFTPAHTHQETLSYRIDVDEARILGCLQAGWHSPVVEPDRILSSSDSAGILALHDEIERGARWRIVRAERAPEGQRLHLCRD